MTLLEKLQLQNNQCQIKDIYQLVTPDKAFVHNFRRITYVFCFLLLIHLKHNDVSHSFLKFNITCIKIFHILDVPEKEIKNFESLDNTKVYYY